MHVQICPCSKYWFLGSVAADLGLQMCKALEKYLWFAFTLLKKVV